MNDLEVTIDGMEGKIVIAGDFNARAQGLGMQTTNSRGIRIWDISARKNLYVVNEGEVPTFRRPGFGESMLDITLALEAAENYTGSDH